MIQMNQTDGRVLLISMPMGAIDRPALGISLLKAGLEEKGVSCEINYLTFAFAEFIGLENYEWITSGLPYNAFVGDWLFTQALYGDDPAVDAAFIQRTLQETWRLTTEEIDQIITVQLLVPQFLDYCMDSIDWEGYDIVGFTSTFQQNIASLALAKRIKEKHPRVAIVFGGANWEGEMGIELHRHFHFVDYVCDGEADETFPLLVNSILRHETLFRKQDLIKGIVYRYNGISIYTGHPAKIANMDSLPIPDYSDYFDALSQATLGLSILPTLLIETSRGCWWGEKSHCKFCGLNGSTMAFRSKSASRVIAELEFLVEQWQVSSVSAVDNILDMQYFNTLLPLLAEKQLPISLYYEIKANLKQDQVKLLSAAGIHRVQPGIESMSNHILKLMGKGVSTLQNIQLLKWCKSEGIEVDWNILYGFPGETKADYKAMLALLKPIRFLDPPGACGSIRLDRFSPYYNNPDEYNLTNLRAIEPYFYLYPFDAESVNKISCYFDFDYHPSVNPKGFADDLIAYANAWREHPDFGGLFMTVTDERQLMLTDTRTVATQSKIVLEGMEKLAYEFCEKTRSLKSIASCLDDNFPGSNFTVERLSDYLASLIENNLMLLDEGKYLSLAIPDKKVQ